MFAGCGGLNPALHQLRIAGQAGAADLGPVTALEDVLLAILVDGGAAASAAGPVVCPLPADLVIGDFPRAVAVLDPAAILEVGPARQSAILAQIDIPDALAAFVHQRAVLQVGLDFGAVQRTVIARHEVGTLRDRLRIADPLARGQGDEKGGDQSEADGFHARLRGLVPGFPWVGFRGMPVLVLRRPCRLGVGGSRVVGLGCCSVAVSCMRVRR